MNYQTTTLGSGMRVIHLPSPSAVIYCGIAVKAGSRHEQEGQEGLAHFCEHLSFKGTPRRSAVQIINAIEGVGGELNAFTNKEDTVYYCAIQKNHLRRAVDVLTDIVFNSDYPQHEIEKECEVVCDEIESYEDSPSELIFDEFENILFAGHPLGHNILGTAERVRSYTHDDVSRFSRQWYTPANSIFFASGDIDFRRLVRMLEEPTPCPSLGEGSSQDSFGDKLTKQSPLPLGGAGGGPVGGAASGGGLFISHRGTHQAHVMMGGTAFAVSDSRRWALYLLNNILGGPGLNSRLNLSLRERHGLVYTVDSSMVSYGDTGAWSVYFGCDPGDTDRCRRLVRRELDRLMEKPLTKTQLAAAKRQLQGQLAIAADSREQFALDFAKNFLHTGKMRDLTDIMAHIDALTADDLQQVAQQLFHPDRVTTLFYE